MTSVEKIAGLIRDRGLTQQAVEDRCRLPRGRISKWLTGRGEPTATDVVVIAGALEVEPAAILPDPPIS